MTNDFTERLVVAFESIAKSLAGIDESAKKAVSRVWPEPKEPRQAVVSRVATEEDRIREAQGSSTEPITEWLSEIKEEPFIGEREKAFLEEQEAEAKRQRDANAKVEEKGKSRAGGSTKARRKG